MIHSLKKLRVAVLCMTLILLSGCDAPEVVIVVAPEYADATIQIDFVKVPRSEIGIWMAKDLNAYFSHADPLRAQAVERDAIYSVHYNIPDLNYKGLIPTDDPVWERFKFDTGSGEQDFDILVLADLPGVFEPGPNDPRRRVIPLYRKAWPTTFLSRLFGGGKLDQLTVTITEAGILLDPAPSE
jgi:hypothetical protein